MTEGMESTREGAVEDDAKVFRFRIGWTTYHLLSLAKLAEVNQTCEDQGQSLDCMELKPLCSPPGQLSAQLSPGACILGWDY